MTRSDGIWTTVELTEPSTGSAWEPDVAIDALSGRFFVSWLDLRDGGRPKPWVARSDDGEAWQALQVDPINSITDNPRGDASFVRVAAQAGAVFVAFSDFREFSWDVYLSSSADGAQTFAPARRINPLAKVLVPAFGGDPVEAERIHGDVALALDSTGSPVVAWTERQDRRYESHIRLWRNGETARIDDAPDGIDAWRPALAVNGAGDVLTVWQDLRQGTNRIRIAKMSGPALEPDPSTIVDDAAAGTHVYAPQIATLGPQSLIVWEDPRSGYATIRFALGD